MVIAKYQVCVAVLLLLLSLTLVTVESVFATEPHNETTPLPRAQGETYVVNLHSSVLVSSEVGISVENASSPAENETSNETPVLVDIPAIIIDINGTNSLPSPPPSKNETLDALPKIVPIPELVEGMPNETPPFVDVPAIIIDLNDTNSTDTNASIMLGNETRLETLPEMANTTNETGVNDSNATSSNVSTFSEPLMGTFQEAQGDTYSVERTASGSGGTALGSTFTATSYSPSGGSGSSDGSSESFSANVGFFSSTSPSGAAGGDEGGAPPGGGAPPAPAPAPAPPIPTAPIGGVGGGGPGGPACTFVWECTSWSDECTGGKQTRVCTNVGTCKGNEGKPAEVQSCKALFDIWLSLKNIELRRQNDLAFTVTMIETNEVPKTDVFITYSILDRDEGILFSETETKAVQGSIAFEKILNNLNFGEGQYTIRVEIIYGRGQRAYADGIFRITDENELEVVEIIQGVPPEVETTSLWLPLFVLLFLLLLLVAAVAFRYLNKKMESIQTTLATGKSPQPRSVVAFSLRDKQKMPSPDIASRALGVSGLLFKAAGIGIASMARGIARGLAHTKKQTLLFVRSGVSGIKSALSTKSRPSSPAPKSVSNPLIVSVSRTQKIPSLVVPSAGIARDLNRRLAVYVGSSRMSMRDSIGMRVFFASGNYLGRVFEFVVCGRKIDSVLITTDGRYVISKKKGVSVKQKDVVFGDIVLVNEQLESAFNRLVRPLLAKQTKHVTQKEPSPVPSSLPPAEHAHSDNLPLPVSQPAETAQMPFLIPAQKDAGVGAAISSSAVSPHSVSSQAVSTKVSMRNGVGRPVFFSSGESLGKVFEFVVVGNKLDSLLIETGGAYQLQGKKGVSVKPKDILSFSDIVLVSETVKNKLLDYPALETITPTKI